MEVLVFDVALLSRLLLLGAGCAQQGGAEERSDREALHRGVLANAGDRAQRLKAAFVRP
jgi:hypothetical protein